MGTSHPTLPIASKGHTRTVNSSHSISKSVLYEIRRASYHNLSSPCDLHHNDCVWKKWHCNSMQQARSIFVKLSNKMQDDCQAVTRVKDVHSSRIAVEAKKEHGLTLCENNKHGKSARTNNQMYVVKAKIEYSHNNLKQHMKYRKRQNNSYSLQEMWQLVGKLCVIAQTVERYQIDLPVSLSSYLIFANHSQDCIHELTIKIKDPWIFGEIKLEMPCTRQLSQRNTKLRKSFSRIITNLALLIETDADLQTTIPQINRVNLKYNVNLATFVYCLKQQPLNTQEITKLYLKLEQSVIPRAPKISQKAQLSEIYSKTVTDSTLPTHMPCSETQENNCNRIMLFQTQTNKQIKKCTSQQILPSLGCQRNRLQANRHPHRIQQIRPKNKMKKSEYLIVSQNGFKDHQNQQQNGEKLARPQQHQNKQNMQSNTRQQKQSRKTVKNKIQIVDHQFPRKNVKHAIRNSTATSEDSKNLDRSSSARNQAFMRLTGGSNYDLYNHGSSEQLLESIIESEESIIVKNNQSPLLSLDQQMEQIAQDFLKFQNQFNLNSEPTSAEREPDQEKSKTDVRSFAYHRNSTIIQVTQYNTEEQCRENEDDEQILDQTWSKKLEASPSPKYKHGLEQQIVKKTQVSIENQQPVYQYSNNMQQSQRQQQLEEESQSRVQHDAESGHQQYVIEQYEGGSKYEGYIRNGLRHGFGKLYYEDGGSYQGEWKAGDIEGFGKLYYQSGNLAYQGYWSQGEFHGEGKIINQIPQNIDGQFNFTDFSDLGTAWVWYEGNFEHDQKDGNGTILLSNGQKFTGVWCKNNVQGQGTFVTTEGKQIKGRWSNNTLVQIYRSESVEDDFNIS